MTSILASRTCIWSPGDQEYGVRGRSCRNPCLKSSNLESASRELFPSKLHLLASGQNVTARKLGPVFSSTVEGDMDPDDASDGEKNHESTGNDNEAVNSESLRKKLERIVGRDDSTFSGIDLATLIRNKFGRSYDVQLIKKEFMGRNLLALNVMWKYREQRSFPLTEEEYILRLDDVANTLKCWGAVSHVRNSLEKLREKERPRIGKAISIFIDMDESGGRANEWIYK
ncbi:OLC1v1033213C3 [Oldenlandia corymbosa var. corymbosa]|uniref:OLC1v1033213C3 n=1 Tax=Oldenlandia corymbosa var. corymbosa TaxID=529605 RepID=A0AAV1CQR9_OLDCO|nr:OLC1v1033213C3 [Oldenlandia corymbosa var. corymbosa]